MDILYLLVPLSLGIVALVVWALLYAVRSGQFEDLEGPAQRILMDDDGPAERAGDRQTPEDEDRDGDPPARER